MGSSTGASQQAAAYRQSAQAVYGAAAFNIGVLNVNLNRKLEDSGRLLRRTVSTQTAQAAGSGFRVGSKSFMAIRNETVTEVLRRADQLREDAEFERQRIWYEAQVRATNLENQARAAEAAGRAQRLGQFQQVFGGIQRIVGGLG